MRRLLWGAALAGSAIVVACSASSVPPLGEVLLVVDTDLPVPSVTNRLRVDTFTSAGEWFGTADFSLPEASSWPASFGVDTTSTTSSRDVFLRLRAYSDGSVRRYEGERYQPLISFEQVFTPTSLAELCAGAPTLALGETVRVRRGREPFGMTLAGGECDTNKLGNNVGTAGAYVDIAAAGSYCFSAIATVPAGDQVTLALRAACDVEAPSLACDDGVTDVATETYVAPVLSVTLEPGHYFLAETSPSQSMGPSDAVLAAVAGGCDGLPAPPPVASEVIAPAAYPLTLAGGAAPTPAEEPEPGMTVDRLVKVTLQPGVVGAVHVKLTGECVGAMSKLGDGAVDLAHATTCLDGAHRTAPVVTSATSADLSVPTPSVQGTFAPGAPCPESTSPGGAVCMTGGPFVLGGYAGDSSSVPPRVAAVSTFWIDPNEVTIARLRAAVDAGLTFDRPDDVLTADTSGSADCLWTASAGTKEDFAVTCISWYAARAFCHSVGGDLPTEAQWEYAATGGGGFKTTFPWGYDAPQCSCAAEATECHAPVFGRQSNGLEAAASTPNCPGSDPLPTSANVGPSADTSTTGVSGLVGGVSEWVMDAQHAYASPCWLATTVVDPLCWEPEALRRSWRGASWFMPVGQTLPTVRNGARPARFIPEDYVGFRCVYAREPR